LTAQLENAKMGDVQIKKMPLVRQIVQLKELLVDMLEKQLVWPRMTVLTIM
jgi:hypothetical protein